MPLNIILGAILIVGILWCIGLLIAWYYREDTAYRNWSMGIWRSIAGQFLFGVIASGIYLIPKVSNAIALEDTMVTLLAIWLTLFGFTFIFKKQGAYTRWSEQALTRIWRFCGRFILGFGTGLFIEFLIMG